MSPGSTVRGQHPGPVPHGSAAGGTGDSCVRTLPPVQRNPCPRSARPRPAHAMWHWSCYFHGAMLFTWSHVRHWNVSLGESQELPHVAKGTGQFLGASLSSPGPVQVTTATTVTAKLE